VHEEKGLFSLSFLTIFFYFLAYVVFGEDSTLNIGDNLDSNVAWVKILLDRGNLFSSPNASLDQVFNGIPLSSLMGSYDISLIWFKIFGIYWGYVFNRFLLAIVGFLGMYFLLKRHFLNSNVFILIPVGVALLYALLPFWSFTMTVAGLPLLLFAFLNLRSHNSHYSNWIIIMLFPFCSSLVLSGVFFIILITLLYIYDTFKLRVINFRFLSGIILLGVMYLISHFPLFYSFFQSSVFLSHRVEFQTQELTLSESLSKAFEVFINGQFHAHSKHKFILIPTLIGVYLMLKSEKINKRFMIILLFIIITSVFFGLYYWSSFAHIAKQIMSFLPIQLNRFHFLHPMFWYILFAFSLVVISIFFSFGKHIVTLILILQFLYVLKQHELFKNRFGPSFSQFYAEEQFGEIKSFINKPQKSYRVISLGLHPAISQFNGFYTLDGYIPNYSLSYKHEFRKIISCELNKKEELKDYFDNWGSRCYAFSSEFGRDFLNPGKNKIEHLDFNYDAFKNLGGDYIISSVEVDTIINDRVKLLQTFNKDNGFWKIRLYEVH
jgi:hypothetical protein